MIYTITLDGTESVMGKGVDVSLILKKLGVDSIATGIIHKTREKKIDTELDKAGISHAFINPSRSRKISAQTQQELLDYLKENLQMGDTVVVAGKFATGIDPAYLIDIATLTTKKMGYVVVDVPYATAMDILPLHPLLIKPNKQELKDWFELSDKSLSNEHLINLAHEMVADGADHVLLSLGKEGAAIVNLMHAFIAPAPEVDVVDDNGAGATLLATFLAGITKNYAPVRNLADSIAAATDTVQSEWLTDFEKTADLQRQVIAEKISFEKAQ
ncbi:1-phosphofructokinase [Lactobacillus colini]|uniref:Tagatose-6-phosphate kinase n=1 Tax=Lactobacillus colini TaxID=1819254 RepID=A0ABS4MCK2_9LACO|nr:PfkB family carbohydrate kinase [Lactobacillus colini]MBP2057408.1 1-phosphofructokinase [Lactobacillus colini]